MAECAHIKHGVREEEKKYRLADFFNAHWEKYLNEEHKSVTIEQYRAVSAMRVCRTAVLGADHYVCDECGDVSEVFHNCRNRFCPTWEIL